MGAALTWGRLHIRLPPSPFCELRPEKRTQLPDQLVGRGVRATKQLLSGHLRGRT